MNYVQIQQFLVLSKTMNMTKAAKELYITQPALSHSLSKMEDELGLKLVYRDGNRLVMTEAGRAILQDFQEIESAYDRMFAHARRMGEEKARKIVLGFSGSVTAFYALFSYGMLSAYQGITIDKVFAEKPAIENMLLNGQLDFAITFPPISGTNIESRILVHDPIGLAVAGGHPLLHKMKIELDDLVCYPMMALTKDNPFAALMDQTLQRRGIRLMVREYSNNDLMRLIDKGRDGGKNLCFSSRKQFSSWYGRGYRWIPIADLEESLDTAVSWMKDADFGYEYKGLIQEIEKNYDRVYYRNYRNLKPQ